MRTIFRELILVAAAGTVWHTSSCSPPRPRTLAAEEVCRKAHEVLQTDHPPSSDDFLAILLRVLDQNGPEAERLFNEEVIARWPTYAAARFARARRLFRFGNIDGAAREARIALRYAGHDSDAVLAQKIEVLLTRANIVLRDRGAQLREGPDFLRQPRAASTL